MAAARRFQAIWVNWMQGVQPHLGAVPHDLADLLQEAHLQKPVRLVQHQRGQIFQAHTGVAVQAEFGKQRLEIRISLYRLKG